MPMAASQYPATATPTGTSRGLEPTQTASTRGWSGGSVRPRPAP